MRVKTKVKLEHKILLMKMAGRMDNTAKEELVHAGIQEEWIGA